MQTTICRPTKRLYLMVRKKSRRNSDGLSYSTRSGRERIDEDFEALNLGKGYDHTYILNKKEENDCHSAPVAHRPKPAS